MAYFECPSYDSTVLSLPTTSQASGAIAKFNTDLTENLLSAVAEFSASQASGTPTPSAPIPIVGVDKVIISRTGANLWDEEWELGIINDSDGQNSPNSSLIRSKNYIPVNPSATYYFNLATKNAHVFCYDQNKTYLGYINLVGDNTFTPLTNTAFVRFRMNTAYGTTYNNDLSINYPSTDTEYHAYTGGSTVLINLGDTYYGGTVDAVTGKITLTHGVVDMGELNWTYSTTWKWFYNYTLDIVLGSLDILSPIYEVKTVAELVNDLTLDNVITVNNNSIVVRNLDYTDANIFKTAMNGIILVYPLATPIVVYASNTAEISTINGFNQVYADSGDVECEYFETIKSALY